MPVIGAIIGWLITLWLSFEFASNSSLPWYLNLLKGVALAFIMVPSSAYICTVLAELFQRHGK